MAAPIRRFPPLDQGTKGISAERRLSPACFARRGDLSLFAHCGSGFPEGLLLSEAEDLLLGQPFQGQVHAPDQLLGSQVRRLGSADDGLDDVGGQERQGQQVAEIAGVDVLDRGHAFDRRGSASEEGLEATMGAADFLEEDSIHPSLLRSAAFEH